MKKKAILCPNSATNEVLINKKQKVSRTALRNKKGECYAKY
jgi:hypothetical protein